MKLRLFILFIGLLTYQTIKSQNRYHKQLLLMGSRFDITVVAKDSISGKRYIKMAISEISRIEKIISSWDSSSETSLINHNAGIKPTKVSDELFNLIKRSIAISKLTDGAFDISYASMDKIWKFDGSITTMPSDELVENSVRKVGFQNIILNDKKKVYF
jgi:thiamine biosynthesis lipoprotein